MTRTSLFVLSVLLSVPTAASAQRQPAEREVAPATVEAVEPTASPRDVRTPSDAGCRVAVQIPEEAVTDSGQVSVSESRSLPGHRWTHVAILHRSEQLRRGAVPAVDAVAQALAELDVDGDGMLSDSELGPRVRGGNGISIELVLPTSACQ